MNLWMKKSSQKEFHGPKLPTRILHFWRSLKIGCFTQHRK
jgi:hypothetical protein